MILNPLLDKKSEPGTTVVKSNSAKKIETLMEEMQITEIWRDWNPNQMRYSWYRVCKSRKIQASRIDYGLVSTGIADLVHNCFYLNGVKSDHSAYFVGINVNDTDRGPGFWKLNTTHLSSIEFVNEINELIQCCREKYKNQGVDPITRWELLKREIKDKCVELGKKQARDDTIAISQLNEYIIMQEDKLSELSDEELQMLKNSKEELETLLFKKTKAIIFRSKATWAMESERNTRYFYNLERNKYNSKTCAAVFNKEGHLVVKPEKVLEVQREFYTELYTADGTIHFALPNLVEETVPEDDIAREENTFSIEELSSALRQLKNGSCPGSDGLPTEFYKVFWRYLSEPYYEYAEAVITTEETGNSTKTGVLNLIPKGKKDTRYLKNLRPITLLNTDYKILERAIANRMIPALCEIIHPNQTGFLPERRIATNIRKILDVVCESEVEQQDNIIMTCDYLKCFDRIEYECIHKALEYFEFSKVISKYVRVLYTGFKLKVQNNGFFSKEIQVTRGVHQGGPASNAIFIAVAELLAIALRKDETIEGVYVKDVLNFLNQYADDMDVSLKYSEKNLNRVLEHIEKFHSSTGFLLSYEKTTIYRVGSLKKSKAELYTPKKMNWTSDKINVLGVDITNGGTDKVLLTTNYEDLVTKSEQICNSWARRNLSLMGKIEVINTAIASMFVYKMSVLPRIPEEYINRLHNIFEKFIWNGHRAKIPLKILQTNKEEGGANLIHMGRKDDSLKCAWISMLF